MVAERRVNDTDLSGRAVASPFTMVTRRNLYTVGIGRFVVFYWKSYLVDFTGVFYWRAILWKLFGQGEQRRKLPLWQIPAIPCLVEAGSCFP